MRITRTYRPERVISPVTPFVHKRQKGGNWGVPAVYDPPLPPQEMGKGYPVWTLSHQGRELYFASPLEMAHVAEVMGSPLLPRPWQLYGEAGYATGHWLARLHKSWKATGTREKLAHVLSEASKAQS
ncbi:hypothetical protein [Henriciella marina]|uniref:hypothetical protein n=1 Tax=Henriciella marina TaxID=453851 RepID=UPI0003662E11|nr:hypothetical protein [Henriciella marina]